MQKPFHPMILGLAHGVVDASTGFMLAGLIQDQSLGHVGAMVVLYNALAFSLQPLVGFNIDRRRMPKAATVIGLLLVALALLLKPGTMISVSLAGVGSACFHTGGGGLAFQSEDHAATRAGLFTAPGVLGLAIGAALALMNQTNVMPFVLLLFVSSLLISWLNFSTSSEVKRENTSEFGSLIDEFGLILLLFGLAVSIRSVVWNAVQVFFGGQTEALIALALAATIGKLLGGLAGDFWGENRFAISALFSSSLFMLAGKYHFAFVLIGVALFQSTTPVLLALFVQMLSRCKATATGLVLGLAIAAGGLPFYGRFDLWMTQKPLQAWLLGLGSLVLFWGCKTRLKLLMKKALLIKNSISKASG